MGTHGIQEPPSIVSRSIASGGVRTALTIRVFYVALAPVTVTEDHHPAASVSSNMPSAGLSGGGQVLQALSSAVYSHPGRRVSYCYAIPKSRTGQSD